VIAAKNIHQVFVIVIFQETLLMKNYIIILYVFVSLDIFFNTNVSLGASYPDVITVGGDTVVKWNFSTTKDIFVKSTNLGSIYDITQTNDGRYLGFGKKKVGSNPAFFEINPSTGYCSLMSESSNGPNSVMGLVSTKTGDLFAWDLNLGFIDINPSTFAYTPISIKSSGYSHLSATNAMAISPTGEIYTWAYGYNSSTDYGSMLFKIDLDSRTANAIGGYEGLANGGIDISAMAFTPDGNLFGFTDIGGGINGGPFV
jgi:hypothetical protein